MGAQHKKKQKPVSLASVAGCEGRFETGRRDVPDPLEPGATIRATVNVKATTLEHMFSRHRINSAQHAAGTRFAGLGVKASIGRQKSFDYSQPAVDGGGAGDPITDDVIHATELLNGAAAAVGMIGYALLFSILVEGKGIAEVARAWAEDGGAVAGERAEGYITGRFIEALDAVVAHWRMEAEGRTVIRGESSYRRNGREVRSAETIRAERGITVTGPAYEAAANRFGDVESKPIQPDRMRRVVHGSGSAGRGGGRVMKEAA